MALFTDRLDRVALTQGVSVALFLALPFGVAAALVHDDRRGLATALTAIVLIGLLLGAAVAAWKQRAGTPLTHGLVTATGVFVFIQAIGVVRRAASGLPLHWGRIASSLVVSAIVGVVGGLLGNWTIKPTGGDSQAGHR